MKKLFSTKASTTATNLGLFLLRLFAGGLMIGHGLNKLQNFEKYAGDFMNFMGLGASVSLGLTVFAELFCAFLLVLGLATRLAAIPLAIAMAVALFIAHKGEILGDGEHSALYLGCYLVLLFTGPGGWSLDAKISGTKSRY